MGVISAVLNNSRKIPSYMSVNYVVRGAAIICLTLFNVFELISPKPGAFLSYNEVVASMTSFWFVNVSNIEFGTVLVLFVTLVVIFLLSFSTLAN